jgi:hypothetical protein
MSASEDYWLLLSGEWQKAFYINPTNRLYVDTLNALLDSISNLRIQSERSVYSLKDKILGLSNVTRHILFLPNEMALSQKSHRCTQEVLCAICGHIYLAIGERSRLQLIVLWMNLAAEMT